MPQRRNVHYNNNRRVYLGGTRYGRGYGRRISKGAVKCYAIGGSFLLFAAIALIVVGALCLAGVISGTARAVGSPMLSIGMGLIMTSLVLLVIACMGAMQQGKAAPAPATNHRSAAFPSAPTYPPPPFQPGVQPVQPPPYSWTSSAPFGAAAPPPGVVPPGGAPLGAAPPFTVQGPYSGFTYTSFPESGNTGNTIPPVSS